MKFLRRYWFPLTAVAIFAIGGIGFVPTEWAPWLAVGAAGLLFAQFLVLLLTGRWSAPLGFTLLLALIFSLGAWGMRPLLRTLSDSGEFLTSLEAAEPYWLILLLLIPGVIALGYRRLAALGPVRRWLVLGARSLLIALLVLALAELHARRPDHRLCVLFLWDRSLSIPPEWEEGKARDQRQERILRFINTAVAQRGTDRQEDKVGVIVFGRQPRLELPPSSVPQLNFRKVQSPIDPTHTDIAAAFKLALASFPEGAGKRIVLISDGNENLGSLEEQARIAKQNGVQVDVLPIDAGRRDRAEVLVERLEAPLFADKDSRLPMHVVIRSHHPQVVAGRLELIRTSLEEVGAKGAVQPVFISRPVLTQNIKLRQGLNVFQFQQPGLKEGDSFTYEAKFVPIHVEDAQGKVLQEGLPGDRLENNRASANVMARGSRAVLLIEPKIGEHQLLIDRIQGGGSGVKVVSVTPAGLPQDPAQLAIVLNRFDGVIIANVPAEDLPEAQQRVIRSNTHDQGAGLIVIGGPQSFGAGGWMNTEIEKALPVTSDIQSMKIEGRSGLVLMMHASEMAEGNGWQKKIAKLAIDKLSPIDMLGLMHWNGNHEWHIPFQEVGGKRGRLIALVDTLFPGDMPDVDPAFSMAYGELTKAAYALGTKHIILISDGDHWDASAAMLRKLRASKITCTTVCITTHGRAEIDKMAFVAQATNGRSYHIKDPSELPAIYIRETRLVSQSFTHEKAFTPKLNFKSGPTEGMGALPDLFGFVRTTRRPSPLVEVPIETPQLGEYKFPILAHWQYGLGKAVAFTSDARTTKTGPAFWDRDWANSDMYNQFWKQTVEWALRPTETGKHLHLATEVRDGKVRVIVEALDQNKRPITGVKLQAGISSPLLKDGKKHEIQFEQKTSGIYEAEFPAEEVGAYFLNIKGTWKDKDGKELTDSVRGGITIPYSPEFAEMEGNSGLLDRTRDLTSGESYRDDDDALAQAVKQKAVFRPQTLAQRSLQNLWYYLVLLAGLMLLIDIALRRISIEPAQIVNSVTNWWARLQGKAVVETSTGTFLDRLKTKKAAAVDSIDESKRSRRFEPGEGSPLVAPPSVEAPGAVAKPPTPQPEKKKEEPPEDFATRLMKAKKKALEDRDKQ